MCATKRGFTLLEMIIVVVLISLLAGFAGVHLAGKSKTAKIKLAETMIKGTLGQMLENYYLDNDVYPTTEQGLEALVEKPSGSPEPRSYPEDGYMDEIKLDPWDMPYQYACPGTHNTRRFDLWSMGPDRQAGTADDIVNWRVK